MIAVKRFQLRVDTPNQVCVLGTEITAVCIEKSGASQILAAEGASSWRLVLGKARNAIGDPLLAALAQGRKVRLETGQGGAVESGKITHQ